MEYDLLVMVLTGITALAVLAGYACGRTDYHEREDSKSDELAILKHELMITRKVQHNLNCLVGDLRYDLYGKVEQETQQKADALAYGTCVGLWATDQPNLIKHHIHRERFFRIGYPEHKL